MICPCCGKFASEINDFQAWCDKCSSRDEVIVDNINAGHEDEDDDLNVEDEVWYRRLARRR